MRKFMSVTVAGVMAALALAAPALAVQPKQQIKASISPTKIGKAPKKPVGVTLNVNPFFDASNQAALDVIDAAPFATKIAHLYFDKNIAFNTKAFATCASGVIQNDEKGCPKGSKVGSGTAVGRALKLNQTDLKVTAFNGPSKHFYLHVVGSSPLVIDQVLIGTLKNSTGPYGTELRVVIPPGLISPQEGLIAALTDFRTSIPKSPTGKGKVSYVTVKACPKGGLKLGYKGEYTDNTSQTVTTKIACK